MERRRWGGRRKREIGSKEEAGREREKKKER